MSTQKILYKRTSTGATQMWWMEVDGPRFRAFSGQLKGAITPSNWTLCVGKNLGRSNETSPEQQAQAEVDAKYVLQQKKGYRDTVDEAQGSTRFQCMTATKFLDRKDKIFDADGRVRRYGDLSEIWLQPKYDGIRCIANAHGLWSRPGNRIVAVPHIELKLAELFDMRPDLILDGELYNHELKEDFDTIVSLVKKTKPTNEDLRLSAKMVQYWVYDGLIEDRAASFQARFVNGVAPQMRKLGPTITDSPTNSATTLSEVDAYYENWLLDGFEGMMLRLDLPYEMKRSMTLVKRKEFQDAEFEILKIEEGVGNCAGMAKIAHVRLPNGGVAKADIVGQREELRELLGKADEVVGKMATIEFQNYTPSGSLRFPKLKIIHHTERW